MLTVQVLTFLICKKISGDHGALWGAILTLGEFCQLAPPCVRLKTTRRYRGHLQRERLAWLSRFQRSHLCQRRHPKRGSTNHRPSSEPPRQKFRRTISVVFHRPWRPSTSIPTLGMSF